MDTQPLLDGKLAYLMLRFTLGLNILMHGLVRMPHLSAFADGPTCIALHCADANTPTHS